MGLPPELEAAYVSLWNDHGESPRVWCTYASSMGFPSGEAGIFYETTEDGTGDPGIRILREPAPEDGPEMTGATVIELITLAHERGHAASWRAGTYVPGTMAEEHRAWTYAEAALRQHGFYDWETFRRQREISDARHRVNGAPEGDC